MVLAMWESIRDELVQSTVLSYQSLARFACSALIKMPEDGTKIHLKDTNSLYLLYLPILYLRYSPTLFAHD